MAMSGFSIGEPVLVFMEVSSSVLSRNASPPHRKAHTADKQTTSACIYSPRKIYNYSDPDPPYTNDKTTEYPNHEIKAEIRLNASNSPNNKSMNIMIKELSTKNMKLRRSSSGNIITVSGYPPDNGFDRHKVLEIVQKYYGGAQLDQER